MIKLLLALVKVIGILGNIFKFGKKEVQDNKLAKEIKDKNDDETKKNLDNLLNN